jgi:solute:Na+ symporter, SSS family
MWGVIFLAVFLAAMVAIGIWGMRKTKTLNDFFLGGRNIGPWISAFAYGTTYFSAVLFIGFAGTFGWNFGLNSLWISCGNALFGALAAWFILGRRTRRMSQNLDAMTMPEFFAERYGSKVMKLFTAALIFIFLLPYSASVFQGLSYLFEANFHIPYDVALLVMIGITGLYLVLGGYFAVTLTDFIQGIIMLFGSLAMVAILIGKEGGLVNSVNHIIQNYSQHIPVEKMPSILTIASLVFMTSFGTWGLPQMVQKFYAIKDEKVITKAAIATTVFAVVIVFSAYFTGAMSHLFFTPDKLPMAGGKIAFDQIIPVMLTSNLPAILMAVILLLVLSASMSTLSSLVLVSSSSVAIDMYKGHINPKVTKENSLFMMRFLSILFVIISYLVAKFKIAIIVTLMSLSWGVVAGAFMAAYVYGLYWKRTTKAGAAAGMITGMALAIGLFYVLGKGNSPLASSIAMIVPFGVIPLVSLFTKAPQKKIIDKAFDKI